MVRKVLTCVLHIQVLDDDVLHMMLCEVEAILNDRPITKLSDNPNDLELLTPNRILLMKSKPDLPPRLFVKEDLYMKRRWRQAQYMDCFGKDGCRSTFPYFKNGKGGASPGEISCLEISWYWLILQLLRAPGSLAGFWRPSQIRMAWYARCVLKQKQTCWSDR